uniref:Uncharacterized protein n=1 Tax=Rhizophora mucronata TaxID=61149 RepID=A0A2P2QJH0_RHIMU
MGFSCKQTLSYPANLNLASLTMSALKGTQTI